MLCVDPKQIKYKAKQNLVRLVAVDADMLGIPFLYPSTFVNNQNGKNDHMVSPENKANQPQIALVQNKAKQITPAHQ